MCFCFVLHSLGGVTDSLSAVTAHSTRKMPLLLMLMLLQANGEDPPESVEPQIDVEAEVEAAMAAVKQAAKTDVTDTDVLSALLEQEVVSKPAIVQALAVHMLSLDRA